ncbi:3906_t:CDS:2 [Cetraspora pellucida]|uniref:3906_t:CDS:1 n=1 Tax=Cetraspora pellucida TaxID=1433469 RepID=A0A9N8YX05_9GLOM|nr:3906_t:CDS:2 [Cetraspora pellucida]
MAHKQKIKNNIIKQYNNFATNITKMINKPQEIKKEIKKYFEE